MTVNLENNISKYFTIKDMEFTFNELENISPCFT